MNPPKSKINLLLLSNTLDMGGVEEVIRTYVKMFDKERYNIAVICFLAGTISAEIAAMPGVQLLHVSTQVPRERFRQIHAFAKAFKPDIVHNHTGWYGLGIGRMFGAKTVETVHNVYHWFEKPQRVLYGLNAHFADRIIAVSGVVKDFTVSGFFPFFPKKKIQVVHNGIEVHPVPPPETRRRVRAEFGYGDQDVVIGFVGRLTEQKGLEYLLDAFPGISARFPQARVLLIGDGELRGPLEERAERLGIRQSVNFAGYRRDIVQVLCAFDIFALPSLWEGLPISLLEAMAMELPVVATDVGGVKEVITGPDHGILIDAKDIDALRHHLAELVASPEKRRSIGTGARRRIIEGFSAQAMVSATEKIFREIRGERAAAGS